MRGRFSPLRALVLIAAAAVPLLAGAVDMTPPLPTAELQQRYYDLTHELRCMQCQNEALADSTVGLAADLRLQVRELLLAGKTDEEIRDHMVARYSEFILFRPRMNWRNAWLWGLPAMLLVIGGVIVWRIQRQRSALAATDTTPIEDEADRGLSG
jgi:cytochrome c-type biogenesis protein CcmH